MGPVQVTSQGLIALPALGSYPCISEKLSVVIRTRVLNIGCDRLQISNLLDFFTREEEEVRPIFNQLASAVHFLHQRRITHCDIKLENILLGEGGKVKLCDFELATQLVEGQMLHELWGSLPYWAPEILARKPYDCMAGDMWSLGVVLYVLVTGHFPYEESTLEEMYRHIIATVCPIPRLLSTRCYTILARLLTVHIRFRLTSSRLVQRPWLGHIEEHVTPPAKEILPKVVETMCNIGYTCQQVVGALKHLKLDNITATINIIRFKLTSGDSSLQNNIPAVATSLPDPMKRRHSKPALLMKYRSNVRLHTYSCPKVMHYSDNRVPGESLPDSTINPATGDTAVNLNSADGLSDKKDPEDSLPANTINPTLGDTAVNTNFADGLSANFSSPEPPLKGKCIGVVNIAFTEEEPSTEPDMPSDQPQDVPTASGTRPLRKLIKKRMSRALRALCYCCLPTLETEVALENSSPDKECLLQEGARQEAQIAVALQPRATGPCVHTPATGSELPVHFPL
ncbi:putative sperm motility kinase W [Microtus oregoni]|uniref:putative sperm motility kinase W n=1 Tax=Microtus oregoni TaxID=111838 RepID=UPI001BB14DB1|nr:putative sperm motility kinase W [Microtus oregoni]